MKKILLGLILSALFALLYASSFPPFFIGFIDGLTFATFFSLIAGTYLYLERNGAFNFISYSFTKLSDGISRNHIPGPANYQEYLTEKNIRLSNKRNPLLWVALIDLGITLILLVFYYM